MHKAFFGCALALPHLAAADIAADADFTPLLACQIEGSTPFADPTSFGQIDVENHPEDLEFWSNYMAQVQAYVKEEEPYWTDGYTSLSQAEVHALAHGDQGVRTWGRKNGLSQLHAKGEGENWFGDTIGFLGDAVGEVAKVGSIIVDPILTNVPLVKEVATFLVDNPAVSNVAKFLEKNGMPVATILDSLKQGKMPDVVKMAKVMSTIPGLSNVAKITQKLETGAADAAHIFSVMALPDDGKPKNCWIKSKTRKFALVKNGSACPSGQESGSLGGACYDKCPKGQGKGIGPVCWGQCSPNHVTCGPLCLLKGDGTKCEKFVLETTKEAISTGVHAASGDFIGAIFGGLGVAANLANPICANWNV